MEDDLLIVKAVAERIQRLAPLSSVPFPARATESARRYPLLRVSRGNMLNRGRRGRVVS